MKLTYFQYTILGIVGLVALVAFLFHYNFAPRSHTSAKRFQETKTITLVKAVTLAILDFQSEYGSLPVINPQSKDVDNASLVKILCNDRDYQFTQELNPKAVSFLPNSFLRDNPDLKDAWNIPIHVRISNPESDLMLNGQIVPFAVWSEGENQKNEMGEGDDIVGWKFVIRNPADQKHGKSQTGNQ